MAQTNVNIRMDAELKHQFETFCEDMRMSLTTAINLFVKKAVREYRIPFEIGAPRPSEETSRAIAEARTMKLQPASGQSYEKVEEMLKELLK